MAKTGVANLPLHPGKAPRWLFKRMVALSKGITEVISYEYGKDEFLRRLSDPFWFQALSCVLGFDWHSSGTTTVTCGALKEAINSEEYGFTVAGGKGKASRKTPQEIEITGELYNLSTAKIEGLQYSSRMAAKIDNTAIQDGHDLYHHVFLFSENGLWTIIQQGMNDKTNYARRYHWFSENVDNFVCEPHNAILGEKRQEKVLDMTAKQSGTAQKISVDLVNDNPRHFKRDWAELTRPQTQRTLDNWMLSRQYNKPIENLTMPRSINWNKMKEIYDFQPKDYEELIGMRGVGPKTIRALALISDLIYGEKPSWNDPIKFTFAHGGKDAVPYEVDRQTYANSINFLEEAIAQAKINKKEKSYALKRLHTHTQIRYIDNCYKIPTNQ
ncbi:MAG: DUF763 domain-containing protein [Thermoplasmatales archaeon]|nr:DUF763 domain-containing protein [Thermoplasmatales archaeon]